MFSILSFFARHANQFVYSYVFSFCHLLFFAQKRYHTHRARGIIRLHGYSDETIQNTCVKIDNEKDNTKSVKIYKELYNQQMLHVLENLTESDLQFIREKFVALARESLSQTEQQKE